MNSFSGDAMDVAELVRTVVLEVLERIDGQTPRPCVRVLAERDEALVRRIAPLVFPFFGENTDILFTGEDNGGRIPQKYLLPELPCSDMADLALGRASSPLMEEILGLLLHGTEVEVLDFAYRQYADSAPGALYDLYAAYEQKLAAYGLREFRPKAPETARRRESLITAALVEQAGAEGIRTLVVPTSANVTPLAAEAAEALHMNILKQL